MFVGVVIVAVSAGAVISASSGGSVIDGAGFTLTATGTSSLLSSAKPLATRPFA
jgi:hypothetical protein